MFHLTAWEEWPPTAKEGAPEAEPGAFTEVGRLTSEFAATKRMTICEAEFGTARGRRESESERANTPEVFRRFPRDFAAVHTSEVATDARKRTLRKRQGRGAHSWPQIFCVTVTEWRHWGTCMCLADIA